MDRDGHGHHFDLSPVIIVLFGIMAGSVVAAVYQCIVAHSCRDAITSTPDQNEAQSSSLSPRQHEIQAVGTSSVAPLNRPYFREFKDGKCAVCLSELNEVGEEIRVIPECGHAFHMVCVDMWLFSHSNCPLCRAKTDNKEQHVIVVPMHTSSSAST